METRKIFNTIEITTPLGSMIALADAQKLYLLAFTDQPDLAHDMEILCGKNSIITSGYTAPLASVEQELTAYFHGSLREFKTPLHVTGSPFQYMVWLELIRTPYGTTRSYAQIAQSIGKKTAYRAVARANSMNYIAIIIPCHRIIRYNGSIGGYNGGVHRKEWLIFHEQQHVHTTLISPKNY